MDAKIEYRRRHRRCRTCAHTKDDVNSHYCRGWVCTIKNMFHEGHITDAGLRGILCVYYEPMKG